ncbi:MAG: UDP-N-acetylmuramate-L-alanine ligase [Parcubacteria group bacterium GW2011_GWF2_38_8]|nr:MAG: UDP-N-acetylmuramate-L-alanine ligase [Parcubacteria group bacterium GW2011_GWF2_38_8]
MNLDLSKIKKVFFIGIGGIGISALAKMALSKGMEVSGVNDEKSPKTLDPLRKLGIEIIFQKDYKKLPEVDLYVYSDAWLYRGPEIIENAKKTGKPVLSYFEALGIFAKEYKVIAIAGTHGKTTTTAMVAEILVEAGLDPTVIVGSFIKKFDSNFRRGESKYLVVEADEYNRHFLNFHPFITVITNIEADHLDCYKDLADIKNAFDKFLSQSENKILDYIKYLEKVPKLIIPGIHNRMNAAAALAVADFLNIKNEDAQKSIMNFSGTWRRLEKKGETEEGTIIYDDYAHHPTEIKASLEALRELYPVGQKKITVLFQPHLYSRTKALFNDFARCFKGADNIYLLPIFFARENKDESISSEKLASAISLAGEKAKAFSDFSGAEDFIKKLNLRKNDVFVTMGAGEAYKVADRVFNIN